MGVGGLISDFIASIGRGDRVIRPTDYSAWVRINRWVADVSEMLAHIIDKLHPHGFDAIVADDFIRVRELLEQNIKSE